LEGIHGVEAEAAGAEERLVVFDIVGADLEHEVFDHHFFDALPQRDFVFHDLIKGFRRQFSELSL
jgi:hypothetical protein